MKRHLVELDSSSVPLLQEKTGLGAALGRHWISALPFIGARTLFMGFRSNVGAQAAERRSGLFIRFCCTQQSPAALSPSDSRSKVKNGST